ncbi:DUF4347 domain-containing protein, partial [Tenacibaculum sp. UWU-22]|uniref:lectin-like domain-containing protein n=1 Tax=Tenacibaculum sp. UWU-22 TaxID=3234187 RepID=UPI0034DACCB0
MGGKYYIFAKKQRLSSVVITFLLLLSTQNFFANTNRFSKTIKGCDNSVYVDKDVKNIQGLLKDKQVNQNLSVFQLFSHGKPGELLLDGKWLSGDSLSRFITSLISGKDITHLNIYGCEFAKGERGKQAVLTLESALGISVSASDDITGVGGDWDLEVGKSVNVIALTNYKYSLQYGKEITPDMFAGITGQQTDYSNGTYDDISSHLGLPSGSVKIKLVGVDTRQMTTGAPITWSLIDVGDRKSSFFVQVGAGAKITVAHGRKINPGKTDFFQSDNNQEYTFLNGTLSSGLVYVHPSTYKWGVENTNSDSNFNNQNDYVWQLTNVSNAINFTVSSTADGTNSGFRIWIDPMDPCDPDSPGYLDSDGDGIGNACDSDDDNDGILDSDETAIVDCKDMAYPLFGAAQGPNSVDGSDPFSPQLGDQFLYKSVMPGVDCIITITNMSSPNIQIKEIDYTGAGYDEGFQPWIDHDATNSYVDFNFKFVEAGTTTPAAKMNYFVTSVDNDNYETISYSNKVAETYTDVPTDETPYSSGTPFERGYVGNGVNTPGIDTGTIKIQASGFYYGTSEFDIRLGSTQYPGNPSKHSINFNPCIPDGWVTTPEYNIKPDTDGDGVPDYLDLDSDNDGCPDALEGTRDYTYADLDGKGSIVTGVVDGNGVPNGGLSQGVGTSVDSTVQSAECDSCNETSSLFKDIDKDGVGDDCDLDNDNDGILDTDEGYCETSEVFNWPVPNTNVPGNGSYAFGDVQVTATQQIDNTSDSSTYTATGSNGTFTAWKLVHDNQNPDTPIIATLNFSIPIDLSSFQIGDIDGGTSTNAGYFNNELVTVIIKLSDGTLYNLKESDVTMGNTVTYLGGNQFMGVRGGSPQEDPGTILTVHPNLKNVKSIEVQYTMKSKTASQGGYIAVFNNLTRCISRDTDGDGMPDYLDADSDNDNCPDAIEGTRNYDYSDLDGNWAIATGTVNSNGVPNGGLSQGVGTSVDSTVQSPICSSCDSSNPQYNDVDGDGVGDACDLDNDNDGILDIDENGGCMPKDAAYTCDEYIFNNDPNYMDASFHSASYMGADCLYYLAGSQANSDNTVATTAVQVNSTNYPTLSGDVLTVTTGGNNVGAFVVLTTDGLYVHGGRSEIGFLGGGVSMLSVNMPLGVTPSQVRELNSDIGSTWIVTNTGRVYILSRFKEAYGRGASPTLNEWGQVMIDSSTPLTGIYNYFDHNGSTAIAYNEDNNTFYTWGVQSVIGDGTGLTNRNYATPMINPLPEGVSVVQVSIGQDISHRPSYYVLGSNGLVYVLGANYGGELGTGGATLQNTWTTLKDPTGASDMTDVTFISANENDRNRSFLNFITSTGYLYAVGDGDVGSTSVADTSLPKLALGIDQGHVIWVHSGGHFSTAILDNNDLIYHTGHNPGGAFADGTTANRTQYSGNPVVGFGLKPAVTCEIVDTDEDGIPDYLDLDSDNDGCPDALEGTGNYNYSDIDANGVIISGTVDNNGVPNGGGSQGVGTSKDSSTQSPICSSCNPSNPEYNDVDGDGVSDPCDLDDDNDGILDCVENGFTGSVSDYFYLRGSASDVTNDEMILTPDAQYQSGQAWSKGKIDFAESFTMTFKAYLGTDSAGADGIAIVFQNEGINATGIDGLGIGAKGISNGLALELDSYNNSHESSVDPPLYEGHGTIWRTVDQTNLSTPVDLGNLEDGTWKNVVINWDADTQTISYTVDGILAGEHTFSSGGIATEIFGGETNVYFGYTASTGKFTNLQKIKFEDPCIDLPLLIDTDNDGTPDYLDLDSDNDGCPDAIEGTGGYTYSDVDQSGQIVTGDVTSSGVPNNGLSQGGGTAYDDTQQSDECDKCNPNSSVWVDSDGDGIGDFCDVDDDNDGILDTDERPACNFGPRKFTSAKIIDATLSFTASAAANIIDNNQGTYMATTAVTGSEKIDRIEFLNNEYTWKVSRIIIYNNGGDNLTDSQAIKIIGAIDFYNGLGELLYRARNVLVPNGSAPFYLTLPNPVPDVQKVVFRDVEGRSGGIAIRDVIFTACADGYDTDKDGIPNHLDLDSDNDGCPDAIEGTGGFKFNQLNQSLQLDGSVTADGRPILVNASGQGVGSAYTDTVQSDECDMCNKDSTLWVDSDNDGIGDGACGDLDSDNDGILNLDEGMCEPFDLEFSNGDISVTESVAGKYPDVNYVGDAAVANIPSEAKTDPLEFINGYDSKGGASSFLYKFHTPKNIVADINGEIQLSFYIYDNINNSTGSYRINEQLDFDLKTTDGDIIKGYYSITEDEANLLDSGQWIRKDVIFQTVPGKSIMLESFSGTLELNTDGYGTLSESSERYAIIFLPMKTCSSPRDTDGDGTPDYLDLDSDNDGCPDALESQDNPYSAADLKTDGSINIADYPVGTSGAVKGVPASTAYKVGTSRENVEYNIAPISDQNPDYNGTVIFTANVTGTKVTDFSTDPYTTTPVDESEYTYQWYKSTDGGTIYTMLTGETTKTLTISNATPSNDDGIYKVVVKHPSSGCSEEESAKLTVAPCELDNTLTATPVSPTTCNPANDGKIEITQGGMLANTAYQVSYVKDGGAVTTVSPNPTTDAAGKITITGLESGVYSSITVTKVGVSSCSQTITDSVTINDFTSNLTATATTSSHQTTVGGTEGEVTVNASGGAGSYTYLWSPGGATTQTVSNLAPGTYTVTVTDSNRCTTTAETTVNALSCTMTVAIDSSTNIACKGSSTGAINITVTNGSSPSYKWTGPDGFTSAVEDLKDLKAGTYKLTVTNSNGCTVSKSVTLTEPATALTATATTSSHQTTVGGTEGEVTVNASGGAGSYTYSWSPGGATTQTVSNLEPGTYTVTVTDSNRCTTTAETTVNALSCTMTVAIDSSTNIACKGSSTGAINITVTNGSSPSYKWTGPDGFTSAVEDLKDLKAGTYKLTVTNSNGCTVSKSVTLTEPSKLQASIAESPVKCKGDASGALDLTVSGGVEPYTYSWTGTGVVADQQNQEGLTAGTYTVTVTDVNKCTVKISKEVTEPAEALDLEVDATPETTQGASNGTLTATVTGGTGSVSNYTYSWTKTAPETSVDIYNVASPTGVAPGTYEVTVTDENSCTVMGQVTVLPAKACIDSTVFDWSNYTTSSGKWGEGDTANSYIQDNVKVDFNITGAPMYNSGTVQLPVVGSFYTGNQSSSDDQLVLSSLAKDLDGSSIKATINIEGALTGDPIKGVSFYLFDIDGESTSTANMSEVVTVNGYLDGVLVNPILSGSHIHHISHNTVTADPTSVSVAGADSADGVVGVYFPSAIDSIQIEFTIKNTDTTPYYGNGTNPGFSIYDISYCSPECVLPLLTVGDSMCDDATGTYSVNFITNATTVTANAGNVDMTGKTITGVPFGTDLLIKAVDGDCATEINVSALQDCPTDCTIPDLEVGQAICDGTDANTFTFKYTETSGADISVTNGTNNGDGTVSGTIGTDVIIKASNGGNCISEITVESPKDCKDPCSDPMITIGGTVCKGDGIGTYDVHFDVIPGATVIANMGTVDMANGLIKNVSSGNDVTLTVSYTGCDNQTITVTAPNCPNTTDAIPDINNTYVDTTVQGNVLTNDEDEEGNTQKVNLANSDSASAEGGTVAINKDGSYSYTPPAGFTGTDTFTYEICDDGTPQACDTSTVTIEVMPSPTSTTENNDVVANDDTATTE